jgi:hypothetical protein
MKRRRMYGLMAIVTRHGAWFHKLRAAMVLRGAA